MNKRQMETAILDLQNLVARINNISIVLMRCFQTLVDKNLISVEEFQNAFQDATSEMQPVFNTKSSEGGSVQSEEALSDESGSRDSNTGIPGDQVEGTTRPSDGTAKG